MTEEKEFDYENYIKRRLREIDDLDERRYAKELLLGSLGELAAWTEAKYKALEQRIREDLDNPWKGFQTAMTVIDRADYDPINPFWRPVCGEDLKPPKGSGRMTVYLMADDAACQRFMEQGTVYAADRETGQQLCYSIVQPERYQMCMERLYTLFIRNHVPWQTVQTGQLERFFDLVPDETVPDKAQPVFQWGDFSSCVQEDIIPLWNMQEKVLQSQEFRHPCIDEVVYEHVYYVGEYGNSTDGCLVDAGENVRSIRYEKNKVILQTGREIPGDISVCRLYQGDRGNSYGYHYPVLSNHNGKEVELVNGFQRREATRYVSRNLEDLTLYLYLRDTEGRERYRFCLDCALEQFREVTYEEIQEAYSTRIPQKDTDSIVDNELRFFAWKRSQEWGYVIVPVYRKEERLYMGDMQFFPFEHEGWTMNLYDGMK